MIKNRYEFTLLFDIENGNPNGDPDANNMPRIDYETNHGIVTDVSIKRKIRNYIQLRMEQAEEYKIYIKDNTVLNETNKLAYAVIEGKGPDKAKERTEWMQKNFYDVRTFGAVMSTAVNCGQVRGPVQLSFGKSVDPIYPQKITITRVASTDGMDDSEKKNQTMGNKYIIPYGLYVIHGFISAPLAEKSGFSESDLELLWDALINMFDFDRSASHGIMSTQKLFVFKHNSKLGNCPANKLFNCIKINKKLDINNEPRSFNDYTVTVDDIPSGVELIVKY